MPPYWFKILDVLVERRHSSSVDQATTPFPLTTLVAIMYLTGMFTFCLVFLIFVLSTILSEAQFTSFFQRPSLLHSFSGSVASVICQGNTTSQPECNSGDLRLVGGERESEGRVEICLEGFWGTVCDGGFGREEAMVVCRYLDKSLGMYLVCFK